MKKDKMITSKYIYLAASSMFIFFLLDVLTPLGVAIGVIYAIPLLITIKTENRKVTIVFALIATILTLTGFYFSPLGGELWKVIYNRGISIFIIWAVTLSLLYFFNLRKNTLELNEQLKKLNTELDRFVYSASHDLRAPLASLLGLIDLSKKEDLSPTLEQCLKLMNKSIVKLDSFISDITDYSRNLRLDEKIEKIHFKEFITDTYNTLIFMSANKIDFSLNCNEGAIIYSDPIRLNIVIGNLLSNSIRYRSLENPLKLEVDVKRKTEGVEIIIKDNGKGIPEENQSKVFDMFYRATDQKAGSGLGLFIVKETVDKLNGTIHLESKVNVGTTITLNIPDSTPSRLN
jgi:signal transduction histidine kinase